MPTHKKFFLLFLLCVVHCVPFQLQAAQASLPDLGLEATQTILGDQALLKKVLSLAEDPNMQAVLNNPKLMEAVRNGNLELLANHPAIKQLMTHPVVQEIKNKPK